MKKIVIPRLKSSFSTSTRPDGAPEFPPFVYTVIPLCASLTDADKLVCAGIDSDDTVFLFEVGVGATIDDEDPARNLGELTRREVISHAHEGVTCLAYLEGGFLLTAGRDGKIRFWQLAGSDKASLQKGPESRTLAVPSGRPITALATLAGPEPLVAAGTECESATPGDVEIYLWSIKDLMEPAKIHAPARVYKDTHSGDISSLQFFRSPASSNGPDGLPAGLQESGIILAASSADGLISFIDISVEDEDDAVVSVINNKSAVAHFAPLTATYTPPVRQLLNRRSTDTDPGTDEPAPQIPFLPKQLCVLSQDEQLSFQAPDQPDEKADDAPAPAGAEIETETQPDQPEQSADVRQLMYCDYAIALRSTVIYNPAFQDGTAFALRQDRQLIAVGVCKPGTLGQRDPRVVIYLSRPAPVPVMGRASTAAEQTLLGNYSSWARLYGAHGEAVVRDIMLIQLGEDSEAGSVIVTCGEDGLVKSWVRAPKNTGTEATTMNEQKRKKKKRTLDWADAAYPGGSAAGLQSRRRRRG